jgi:hypothetical protein
MEIANKEQVIQLFGEWPSFHDAEVISIELRRGESPGQFTDLFAAIQVRKYMPANVGTAEFEMATTHDGVITLRFSSISDLSLSEFNHQNVIDDISMSQEGSRVNVTFVSIYGVECFFKCAQAVVTDVVNRLQENS